MSKNAIFINLLSTQEKCLVSIMDLNSEKKITYTISYDVNDTQSLKNTILKRPIMIGFNNLKLDSVILSYIVNGTLKSHTEIYDFKNEILAALQNNTYRTNELYVEYKKNTYMFGIIDLMIINNYSTKNIIDLEVYKNKKNIISQNESSIEYCEFINESIRDLYYESKNKLTVLKELSTEYGYNFIEKTPQDTSRALFDILYSEISGKKLSSYSQNITEYNSININEIIPKFEFFNDNINHVYNKIKSSAITKDNGINEKIQLKDIVVNLKNGGIHSVNKPSYYEADDYYITYIDFNSYYANVLIDNSICPSHLDLNNFINTIKRIVNLRDNSIDEKRKIYKNILTGISGDLTYHNSLIRDYKAAMKMYIIGELNTIKIIDYVEANFDASCIMANTDGFIIKSKFDLRPF